MGALPKRRISKGREGRRRLHQKLAFAVTVKCKACGKDKLPHRACPVCGSS